MVLPRYLAIDPGMPLANRLCNREIGYSREAVVILARTAGKV